MVSDQFDSRFVTADGGDELYIQEWLAAHNRIGISCVLNTLVMLVFLLMESSSFLLLCFNCGLINVYLLHLLRLPV